jgi:hypothetical protein
MRRHLAFRFDISGAGYAPPSSVKHRRDDLRLRGTECREIAGVGGHMTYINVWPKAIAGAGESAI